MPECPDCHSNSVQSKGWRTKGVHRYLCNKCGRNFTKDTRPKEELPGDTLKREIHEGKYDSDKINQNMEVEMSNNKMTTIAVSREIKGWIESLKMVDRESHNDVLERIKNKGITRGWMIS